MLENLESEIGKLDDLLKLIDTCSLNEEAAKQNKSLVLNQIIDRLNTQALLEKIKMQEANYQSIIIYKQMLDRIPKDLSRRIALPVFDLSPEYRQELMRLHQEIIAKQKAEAEAKADEEAAKVVADNAVKAESEALPEQPKDTHPEITEPAIAEESNS